MPKIAPLLICTLAGSLYSVAGFADGCRGPTAPTNFPEPSTATADDILAAQQSIKQYLTDMEAALKCMDAAHNDQAHNNAVDDMQKTATKFNTVLRAYKARQKA